MVSKKTAGPSCLFKRQLLLFRSSEVCAVLSSMVIRHGRKHMGMRRLLPLHRKEHLLNQLRKWAIVVFHYMPQQLHIMPWPFRGLLLVSTGCTNCYDFPTLLYYYSSSSPTFPISSDNPYQIELLVITHDTYADLPLLLYPVSPYKPYALLT